MPYRFGFFIAVLVALPGNTAPAAEDWPQFRGPGQQGISAATGVPITWSGSKNVAWKTELPGSGWSSPVLSGGRIYLTSAVTDGATSLRALCVNAADGKVIWDRELFRPDAGATKMHKKNSLASSTPIVENGKLYVHFGHMGTACLDLEGKVIWKQTEIKYSPVHGNGGSPALVDGVLIFSCDGAGAPFVVGLDAATGKINWKTPRNTHAARKFSFSTPLAVTIDGKSLAVLPGSGFVGAYEPATGKEVWRVKYGEGYSVVPRPVYAHGLIYVGSGFDRAVVYAIKPGGAKGDVTETNVAWTINKGAPLTPSMVVVGDEIYFISDGGIATCADAKTGEIHWTHRVGTGGVSASPVVAEGRIYFQNEAGVGCVITAGKTFELLAENDLGERSLASYAVADNALYIRTEKHLWRIGKSAPVQ